jgi:nucleotide-binding universal stress UspA family protein
VSGPAVRTILFATDFSAVSRTAGHTAADFARHFSARLHVLHVVPPAFEVETSRAALAEAVAALGPILAPTVKTVAGLAAREIVAYAGAHGVDLIVMGTHGRTGVSHALLGSVAEAVVRRARCPVLTVPAGAGADRLTTEIPVPAPQRCVVCALPSPDLICEHCRAVIRGEALEHKRGEERAGRVAT